MWVVHWGLLPRLPWRPWVCPCEGQVWRWGSCFSCRGSGSIRFSGELVARSAGNIVLWKGMTTSIGQYTAVFLPGEAPSLTEKPGRPQSTGLQSQTLEEWPCTHRRKVFLTGSNSSPVRVGHGGGAASWLVGTLVAPSVQRHTLPLLQGLRPYQSFPPSSCSWDQ